jgi:hypothetical protein
MQANKGANVVRGILRGVTREQIGVGLTVSYGKIQVAFRVERQSTGEVVVVPMPGAGDEDFLDVNDAIPVEPAPHNGGGTFGPIGVRLAIAQVKQAISGKVRVREDVHEPSLPSRPVHGWKALDWVRIEHTITKDTQSARSLYDQHFSCGQPGHRPRELEILGHNNNPKIVSRGVIHIR